MKKFLILLICIASIITCTNISALAEGTSVMPIYENILNEYSDFRISDSGVATIIVSYDGYEGKTAGATITVKMQKKFLLFFWQDVDLGGTDGAWVKETNTSSYSETITKNVTSGTHRVQIEYVIRNVDGSEEVINREHEYKY